MANDYVIDDYWDDEYCEDTSTTTQFTPDQLIYLDDNYVTIANINDIVSAVLAALQATTIPVNVKQVNDSTITGQGFAPPNHWRPA